MRRRLFACSMLGLLTVMALAACGASSGTDAPSSSPSASDNPLSTGPTPTITASPLPGGLEVRGSWVRVNPTGAIQAIVEVRNVGPKPLQLGVTNGEWFEIIGHDGFTLAQGLFWFGPQYIAPGATGYLGGWSADMTAPQIATIDHVKWHLKVNPVETIPPQLTIVGKFTVQPDGDGKWANVIGTVKNTNNGSDAAGIVVAFLLDKSGAPLGFLINDHTLPGLGAGNSVPVTLTTPQIPASLVGATATVAAYAYDMAPQLATPTS